MLEDPSTKKRICLKLWNDHTVNITQEDKGKTLNITNVEVDNYNHKTTIKTTDMSCTTKVCKQK